MYVFVEKCEKLSLTDPCYVFLSGALTGLHGKRYRVPYTNSKLLVWSGRALDPEGSVDNTS